MFIIPLYSVMTKYGCNDFCGFLLQSININSFVHSFIHSFIHQGFLFGTRLVTEKMCP